MAISKDTKLTEEQQATPAVSGSTQVSVSRYKPSFGQMLKRSMFPYLLILPTFVFIAAFTIWPAINTAIQSTFKPGKPGGKPGGFVGLQNYSDLFDSSTVIGQSDNFTRVLINTLVFAAVTVPVSMLLAFGLALLLNQKLRSVSIYRVSIFYPVLLPLISAASIWAFFFADNFGVLNTILRFVGLQPLGWWRDPNWALPSIMLVVIWKQVGFYMIFYLAGLQNLPTDIYEAAQLDGASAWNRLLSLTVPLLNGTTLFVLVIAVESAFQTADPLFVLGQGQPNNRSSLLLFFIYQHFLEPQDIGYVYAMTILLMLMLLVFTVANFIYLERKSYYES